MADDALVVNARKPVEWFEEAIPIRGCKLSLDDVTQLYRELSAINRNFGEHIISMLKREEGSTEKQWHDRKAFLLNDAFCLTVTIRGQRDQQMYGETPEIFRSPDLPHPIKSVYFNNVTAFARHANGTEPENRLELLLDFGKPELLDPNPLVSEPTPNRSEVTERLINAFGCAETAA